MRMFILGCFIAAFCVGTLAYGGRGKKSKHRHSKMEIEDHDPLDLDETYPDPELTPGQVFQDITVKDLCRSGYASSVRNVPTELKIEIKRMYGIEPEDFVHYSIDHFIPLCLGGTNDISNLWPQRKRGIEYGADEKTKADWFLYRLVCEDEFPLEAAHDLIRTDWVLVYKESLRSNFSERIEERRPHRSKKNKKKKMRIKIDGQDYYLSDFRDFSILDY